MAQIAMMAIPWGVVIGASLVAAVIDVRTRRIPNRLCGSLFLAGLAWSSWHSGVYGLLEALAAVVLLAFPFVLLFIFASGGAGDAKLTGAIGAWLTFREAAVALVCICIAGGILGLIVAVYKRRLKVVFSNLVIIVFDFMVAALCRAGMLRAVNSAKAMKGEKLTVPYAVAIFIGVSVAGGIILL